MKSIGIIVLTCLVVGMQAQFVSSKILTLKSPADTFLRLVTLIFDKEFQVRYKLSGDVNFETATKLQEERDTQIL